MDKQMIKEMAQCKNEFGFTCGENCIYKTSACERYKLAEELYNAGYRKESEIVKEVLQKVKSYTLDKEVGMRYLIQRLGEEYGVEV